MRASSPMMSSISSPRNKSSESSRDGGSVKSEADIA